MKKYFKKYWKISLTIIAFLSFVIYLSYLASYDFNFSQLHFKSNPKIGDGNKFLSAFASISTFLGILTALFKENIFNFLHQSKLEIELESKGTIYEVQNTISLIHHIKVINKNDLIINDVDFYFESIKINSQDNILDVRIPMLWSRSDERRQCISIVDDDKIDFIYTKINLMDDKISYSFTSRTNFPKSLFNLESIIDKSEVIISPRFFNQSEIRKYKIKIEINESLKNEIINLIKSIKQNLIKELEFIISIQKLHTYFNDFRNCNFRYISIYYDHIDDFEAFMHDWSPNNNCGNSKLENCVNLYMIGDIINKLFNNRTLFNLLEEKDIFHKIPDIIILKKV
ncbi:MAG: hypothetical protein RO257_01830 [Candidatus Kapabacteria bacterium]|nr:hypothetical protein [Candidatus Kapabacteria bacterium]